MWIDCSLKNTRWLPGLILEPSPVKIREQMSKNRSCSLASIDVTSNHRKSREVLQISVITAFKCCRGACQRGGHTPAPCPINGPWAQAEAGHRGPSLPPQEPWFLAWTADTASTCGCNSLSSLGPPVNLLQHFCFIFLRSLGTVLGGVSWDVYRPLQRESVCNLFFNKVLSLGTLSFYFDITDTGPFMFSSIPCPPPYQTPEFSLFGTLGYLPFPQLLPWLWLPGSSSLLKSSLVRMPLDFSIESWTSAPELCYSALWFLRFHYAFIPA